MGKISLAGGKEKPKSSPTKLTKKMPATKEIKVHNFNKKKKNASNYFADPHIIPRVEDYVDDRKDNPNLDIDEMVDDLRVMYRDYGRKKRASFKSSVEKAFAYVIKRQTENGSEEEEEEEEDDDEADDDIDDEEGLEGDEDIEVDEDELSGMEDEDEEDFDDEDEDEEDANTFKEMWQEKSNNKHSSSSMKPSQRNGTQELINISSDESDKETPTKRMPLTKTVNKVKANTTQKVPVIATRHLTTTKVNAVVDSNASQPDSLLGKRKIIPIGVTKVAQGSSTSSVVHTPTEGSHSLQFPIKTRVCVNFSCVGGCSKLLKEITQLLIHLRHPEVYHYLRVIPPRGFLLHGPPGTGKTLLARAIAGELKLPLIQVAAPELIRGISGSSEEKIRHLFEQAISIAPCILFLDEIDAITPNRETAQREMERRIVAQLIASMDELTTTQNGNKILVIGATNRPDSIDPALRRAGRFDREVCLGIPSRESRKEILSLITRNLRVSPDVDINQLATNTPGYVGADLKALVTEAAMAAVDRVFSDSSESKNVVENKTQDQSKSSEIVIMDVVGSKDEEMLEVTNSNTDVNKEPSNGTCSSSTDSAKGNCLILDTGEGEPEKKKHKGEDSVPNTDESNEEITILSIEKEKESDNTTVSNSEVASVTNDGNKKVDTSEKTTRISSSDSSSKESIKEPEEIDIINVEEYELENSKNSKEKISIKISDLLRSSQPLSANQLKCLFIEMCDFNRAMKIVQPSAKREGFATVPNVTWDDVGSLKDIRNELEMTILAPVRYPEAYSSLGLSASSGVLLCGPPGCGKTLLAKAIANEAGINFISVKGPELLNMYVGESERAVRQCFMRARNSQPCVIFFDELDALCPKRSESAESSGSMRVVNQLLTEMDGVEGRNGVFVMAATNRPDIIDPAILRPGRLDKVIYVGLPSPTDRIDILKALTKNGTRPVLSDDVYLEEIGQSYLCNGFTGADLSSLVKTAGIESLKEYISNGNVGEISIASRHFTSALKKIRPSVSEKDLKHYEKMRLQYTVASPDQMDVFEM